jgi:hypothetical protein
MRPEWHVFPLKHQSKQPATEHGVLDAKPMADWPGDIQTQMARGTLNVGLACGQASGVYVIDLDGSKGLGAWDGLTIRFGDAPTLLAQTGKGGLHRVYSVPNALGQMGNTAGKIAPGIDTRGDGGYIAICPSVHPNGKQYEWLNWVDPAPLPQWVVDLVSSEKPGLAARPEHRARAYVATKDDKLALRILEEECQVVASAEKGTRNHTLFRCCASMAELVAGGELTGQTVVTAMTSAGLQSGLERREVDRTVLSAFNTGLETPRIIRTRKASS